MFELPAVTQVKVTNANPRVELHGDNPVRAIDLRFQITGDNSMLDWLEPGLREHHFCNREADAARAAGQETLLEDALIPLLNLRFPSLSMRVKWQGETKWRGYRFVRDYGLGENQLDFSDCAVGKFEYELHEGGTVDLAFTVSYNGPELDNNTIYGELSGLAAEGEIHIQLLAPGTVEKVKKGYRAGQPDTVETPKPEQPELLEPEPLEPGSPAAALAESLAD